MAQQLLFIRKLKNIKERISAPSGAQGWCMNHITLTGRLTEDPKVTYSTGSEPVAHAVFSFAVPDMSMKKDGRGNYHADFFRCTCWNRLAEAVGKHCCRGTKLLIAGRLKNNNYEKDGQKIYSNEILIESLEFLETKKQDG